FRNFKIVVSPGNESPKSAPNTVQQQSDNIAINDHASPIRSGNQSPQADTLLDDGLLDDALGSALSDPSPSSKSGVHSEVSSSDVSDQDSSEDQESDTKRTVTTKLNECDVIGNAINDTIDEFL
ncbi:10344_t:CDS:2, partial [Racocetra fulgida]